MPHLSDTGYFLAGVVILAILIIVIFAIRRGRNINVHMEKGDAKFGLQVNGAEAPEPLNTAGEGSGNINSASILNQGQVTKSTMTIQVGHSRQAQIKKE
jgi:hypothetical protein